jgi:hypothetical protein
MLRCILCVLQTLRQHAFLAYRPRGATAKLSILWGGLGEKSWLEMKLPKSIYENGSISHHALASLRALN